MGIPTNLRDTDVPKENLISFRSNVQLEFVMSLQNTSHAVKRTAYSSRFVCETVFTLGRIGAFIAKGGILSWWRRHRKGWRPLKNGLPWDVFLVCTEHLQTACRIYIFVYMWTNYSPDGITFHKYNQKLCSGGTWHRRGTTIKVFVPSVVRRFLVVSWKWFSRYITINLRSVPDSYITEINRNSLLVKPIEKKIVY